MFLEGHPFSKSYFREGNSKIEFRYFKEGAPDKVFETCKSIARYQSLKDIYSFYLFNEDEQLFQINFGQRLMFRKTVKGKTAFETGPTLLYSIGPGGTVAVSLYPAKSDLAKVFEDHIYLRVGFYTAHQLNSYLKNDLRDLVAYGHVSSLDGDPNILEKARIWWLRKTHPMQVRRRYTMASGLKQAGALVEFGSKTLFSTVLMALLKPIGVVIVAALFIRYGMPEFAKLLTK